MNKVELGDKVKDTVTGYVGIAVGISEYLWKEGAVGLQVKAKDGKIDEAEWFDRERVEVVTKKVVTGIKPAPGIFQFGDEVKDVVTGFKGILVARAMWLHGCNKAQVQPKMKRGATKYPDAKFFDESQLKLVKAKVAVVKKTKRTGGPIAPIPRGQEF